MYCRLASVVGLLLLVTCQQTSARKRSTRARNKQVVVVSVPGESDAQYRHMLQEIADFAKEMDQKTYGRDYLFIVHDRTAWNYFGNYYFINAELIEVPEGQSLDLWMRDFPPVMPRQQIEFVYSPHYLLLKEAIRDKGNFRKFATMVGLPEVKSVDLLLEGGNVVENGNNVAITTERIYWGNNALTKTETIQLLEEAIHRKVAVLPEPKDTTGHADGLVSFVEEDTLLMALFEGLENAYFYDEMEEIVLEKFPNLNIVPLPSYVVNKTTVHFQTAEGCYANSLVTYNAVYVPFYANQTANWIAYDVFRANTYKDIVPIPAAGPLSIFGGSVRCMTWQIDQHHPVATKLFEYVDAKKRK